MNHREKIRREREVEREVEREIEMRVWSTSDCDVKNMWCVVGRKIDHDDGDAVGTTTTFRFRASAVLQLAGLVD